MEIYLELGTKRVFAAAVEWPGWCRGGRDEAAAIEALLAYRERYAKAVGAAARGREYEGSPVGAGRAARRRAQRRQDR